MLKQFETLLEVITAQFEVKLSALDEKFAELGRQQQRAKEEQFKEARLSLFRNIKYKTGNVNSPKSLPQQASEPLTTN